MATKTTERVQAIALAEKLQPKKASEYPPGQIVVVKGLDDSSFFVYDNAVMREINSYYVVYPEHHEFQVFHKDEYTAQVYRAV